MQKAWIIGNLVQTPDLKNVGTDRVCTFTVAVNNRKKGTTESKPTYYRADAWNAQADLCGRFLDKGSKVAIAGDLDIQDYTTKDGNKTKIVGIRINSIDFLSPPKAQGSSADNRNTTPPPNMDPQDDDDELPF